MDLSRSEANDDIATLRWFSHYGIGIYRTEINKLTLSISEYHKNILPMSQIIL